MFLKQNDIAHTSAKAAPFIANNARAATFMRSLYTKNHNAAGKKRS